MKPSTPSPPSLKRKPLYFMTNQDRKLRKDTSTLFHLSKNTRCQMLTISKKLKHILRKTTGFLIFKTASNIRSTLLRVQKSLEPKSITKKSTNTLRQNTEEMCRRP